MSGQPVLAALVITGLLVLAALVIWLLARGYKNGTVAAEPPSAPEPPKNTSVCPLCKTGLARGERIHSVIFPGGADWSLMHIFGCPYCYRDHPRRGAGPLKQRNCPSCRSLLTEKEHLYARVYRKPGKDHVSVTGCSLCR
jgi:hypothetical protein